MEGKDVRILSLVFCAAIMLSCQDSAYGYIGPGIGAGALGVVLGLIVSVFLALFALIWYPVKRLLKSMRRKDSTSEETVEK